MIESHIVKRADVNNPEKLHHLNYPDACIYELTPECFKEGCSLAGGKVERRRAKAVIFFLRLLISPVIN